MALYDYRNRTFDPSTGRFIQRDPVLDAGNLYNPYAGMGNNPVGNVDPMGDDWVSYDRKTGRVFWEIQRDNLFCSRARPPIPIGKIVKVGNRLGVEYDEEFGGGGAYLSDLRDAAKNIYSEYGDISDRTAPQQNRIIASILDRVRRGQDLDRYAGGMEAFSEGFTGGFTIGLNTFSFGAFDASVDQWRRSGSKVYIQRSTEFQGWEYDVSRTSFKISRGALMLAGGAQLAGVGQVNLTSYVELTRAAHTTGGIIYGSGVLYGGAAGMERYEYTGDIGDVVDLAGRGGLSAGLLARLSGLHAVPSQYKSPEWTANEIRQSGLHPASRNRRVIAVGRDKQGNLYGGSSNYFDRGQKEAAARLRVTIVKPHKGLHAEEELMAEVDDLVEVGTSRLYPCGPDQHDCFGQLQDRGIRVTNPPPPPKVE